MSATAFRRAILSLPLLGVNSWTGIPIARSSNTNGTIKDINFTQADDIASNQGTRENGSYGKQINVVEDYPLNTSNSCDGSVKLFFNKTSSYPTTIKIIVMGGGRPIDGTSWRIIKLECPTIPA